MPSRPPRGYRDNEHPLYHNFRYTFSMGMESFTKDSTICTIFRTSEAATAPETIFVNPAHPAFVQDAGPLIHNGSIVPRISVQFVVSISKVAIATDAVRYMIVKYAPIYTAFLESLTAEDAKTGDAVEDIVGLQHETTNKDTYPLFETADLPNAGNQPLSTVPATEVFGDYGLTTDAKLQNVTFGEELYYDAKQYYSNSGMLRKVMPGWRTMYLNQNKIFKYNSNNFTNPSVKRGNPYTFCGIMFDVPQAGEGEQPHIASETTDIAHVNIGMHIRFEEWNPTFEQART